MSSFQYAKKKRVRPGDYSQSSGAIPEAETVTDQLLTELIDEIRALRAQLSPIELYSNNLSSLPVTASKQMLAANLVPTHPPSTLEISVIFDTAGIFSNQRFAGSSLSNPLTGNFNGVIGVVYANDEFVFDMDVGTNQTVNFIFSVTASLLFLQIWELPTVLG